MFLEKLQVEEGFLSGLDINLTPGLNVIIGARGTGKTSLIELIRFCLDAQSNIYDTSKKSKEHALSILGSGQVTATLSVNGQTVIATRTGSDQSPRSSAVFIKPIVFSQTEIETIGLEASGRLRLIDGFIPIQNSDSTEEKQVIATIASLTTEAANIRREIDELEEQLNSGPLIDLELKQITTQEATVAGTSELLKQKTLILQALSEKISTTSTKENIATKAKQDIYNLYAKAKEALELTGRDESETATALEPHLKDIENIKQHFKQAHDIAAKIWHSLDATLKTLAAEKIQDEVIARESRQEIESFQTGAGQVMRKGQELREKKAQLELVLGSQKNKKTALLKIINKRDFEFDKLDEIRSARFVERKKIVDQLNITLGPNIRLAIRRNGQQAHFSSLISDLLRGSGIKYGDIALMLAQAVSPRMLLEAVENFEAPLIAESSGISLERTARALTHLRSSDLGALGSTDLEDEVSMQLLDGADYKDISQLSTGQRCTVVLPIVLAHKNRIVVVDQPEDHIDNAFIANTLIRAVLSRDPSGQIIFSTHNPNIPVLGDANNVLQLASDGKRGYIVAKGDLNDRCIVDSISTVMEGGAIAFEKRAAFYSQHPL
ncbi:AAA family ATPase [Pseudomonas lundensis]|uniref:AAA family ATPase n=1 Tax=Pseudomonas lundensis TaxID=86185 RepID=UPI00147295C5|nr:AAA family ATPase [Pseudomonas lundensis]NMZ99117.1 AAA family ATPase [Pseudomonas lundensis]